MEKVIFIDLDGTLLNDNKEISERNIKAVEQIKNNGYEVVVCTGRSFGHSKRFADMLNVNYSITANGSAIYNNKTQQMLFGTSLSNDDLIKIHEIADHENVSINYVTDHARYVTKDFSHLKNCKGDIVITEPIKDFLPKHIIRKVAIISPDFETVRRIQNSIETVMVNLEIEIVEQSKSLIDNNIPKGTTTFYHLSNKGVSKGAAVAKFAEMFEIEKNRRIAIGDEFGDISMFEKCGHTVAPENALPELKNKANFITDTNNNDGVAKFLETLVEV